MGSLPNHHHHFLIVVLPAQGHVNPALHLARRLRLSTGAAVTFSTAVSAHSRMFNTKEEKVVDGIHCVPFSDGFDEYFDRKAVDNSLYCATIKAVAPPSLCSVLRSLAARGRPVTFVIYALLVDWIHEAVSREFDLPCARFWIQPAAVLAAYYYYFNGYGGTIREKLSEPEFVVEMPGLPGISIRDLPSFITASEDDPYYGVLDMFEAGFRLVDDENNVFIVNTFNELEWEVLSILGREKLKCVTVGPVQAPLLSTENGSDLFELDKKKYMEWLDSKADKSVVYVSFGSLLSFEKKQVEEMVVGLRESGRPYLWVVRRDNGEEVAAVDEEEGMVVQWCSQVKVLNHPSVGCFVSHCGWNSTLESLTCGVPLVCVPRWTDQRMNAELVVGWGVGVRGEVNAEGVLEGRELRRCLEIAMGDEVREKTALWKEKTREAIVRGDDNLRGFVEDICTLSK